MKSDRHRPHARLFKLMQNEEFRMQNIVLDKRSASTFCIAGIVRDSRHIDKCKQNPVLAG